MSDELTINAIAAVVAPIARRYPVERVVLFGSRARGDHRPDSDVDLHVTWDYTDKRFGGFAIGGLYNDLEEALGVGVDLVTRSLDQMTEGKPRFIAEGIRRDGVCIYER